LSGPVGRNPLGYEGAAALVKEFAEGLETLVDMLFCTFMRSTKITGFDDTNPAGTYTLAGAYTRAMFSST